MNTISKPSKWAKTFILIFIFLFFNVHSEAQNTEWQWAKKIGGKGFEWATSVAADTAGNIIAAGWFDSPSITVGANKLINTEKRSEVLIAKYDKNGQVLWVKKATGSKYDQAFSVTTDISGNIIVSGHFSSPKINFGNIILTNNNTGDSYSDDMFIVKYDPAGNVLWAKSYGGNNSEEAISVKANNKGEIILTGFFDSPSISLDKITLTTPGLFVAKFAPGGEIIWAKSAPGKAKSLSIDTLGNIFVAGRFITPTNTFGDFVVNNSSPATPNTGNMFIIKYDKNGVILWAKSAGVVNANSSDDDTEAASVTNDNEGNVIVTGNYSGTSISFGEISLTNFGLKDMFIVKYDKNGNVLWAKNIGGTKYDNATSVIIDAKENIIVAGYFRSPVITVGSYTLTCADTSDNYYDMVIIKYNSNGDVLWAKSPYEFCDDRIHAITIDNADNIIIAGYYNYGTLTLGSNKLIHSGRLDWFVSKISNPK